MSSFDGVEEWWAGEVLRDKRGIRDSIGNSFKEIRYKGEQRNQ